MEKAILDAFSISDIEVKVEYPVSSEHGDYSSNLAMQISKDLKKNPREIAEKIISFLPKNDFIKQVKVEGPGFINFFLSKNVLNQEIDKILEQKDEYGSSDLGKNKTIIVEYSAPNIAKPLGVHHLLSTVIGQSLYNLIKKLGYKTVSINHIGDWGTQFGKLIYAYKKWGNEEKIKKYGISEMLKLYIKFHNKTEKSPELEDKARTEFKKFEEGDKENHKLWEWFREESLKEINKTYKKLGGIHFDHTQGESFYENMLKSVLEEGKKKGIFEKGEEGAFVINYEDPNIPTLPIQKKDGTTLYITRDFAALKYRMEEWHPEKILYVVDVAQSMHFKQLFLATKKLGWCGDEPVHIVFGRMQMKDLKMSTRKGNVVLLDEVLDEATNRAKKILEQKNPNLKNKQKASEVIGIGAVKYNVLSQNRLTNITFNWDKMLSLEGNSAPYLQYTYARGKSILRKSNQKVSKKITGNDGEENEKINSIISLFPKFTEQIELSANEYKPNILSNYLYNLAQKFNSFYNSERVLNEENKGLKEYKLQVVQATIQILKNGLELLGVEVLDEM